MYINVTKVMRKIHILNCMHFNSNCYNERNFQLFAEHKMKTYHFYGLNKPTMGTL